MKQSNLVKMIKGKCKCFTYYRFNNGSSLSFNFFCKTYFKVCSYIWFLSSSIMRFWCLLVHFRPVFLLGLFNNSENYFKEEYFCESKNAYIANLFIFNRLRAFDALLNRLSSRYNSEYSVHSKEHDIDYNLDLCW
jgi:hypothetical protein